MIAFYLRLSLADGDMKEGNKDESNSIENQRDLLNRYVEDHDDLLGKIIEYVDDGYTGTNFDRPAFRRMIEDVKKGKIHTILTKDLSRLGRDYIGVGDYLEQVFPVLGVRFIAVNSNYDSNAYSGVTIGLDIQMNNLINHLYSRDISKKIKSAIVTKWKQGKSTSGRLPFGYQKDKEASGGWAIDEGSAKIVRTIFEKAIEGMRAKQIAEYLNEQGLPTPGMYREQKYGYGSRRVVPSKEALWDSGKVRWILGKYEYTGAFVQNYREKVQPGSNITRKVPESERIIIEDAHVAIVTKEEYQAARDTIHSVKKPDYKIVGDYLLRGKVRCGNCRLAMAYHEGAYGGKFYCVHKMNVGGQSECCDEKVPERFVERVVYVAVRRLMWQIQRLRDQIVEQQTAEEKVANKEYRMMLSQIDKKQAERMRQYIAYAEGVIRIEEYLSVKEKLTAEIDELQRKVSRLQEFWAKSNELEREGKQLFTCVEESIGAEKLTREMVKNFVDTVYIYDAKHIEVVFSCEDLLKKLFDVAEGEKRNENI